MLLERSEEGTENFWEASNGRRKLYGLGIISLLGTLNIVFIDGRMNSIGYQALLEEKLPYMAQWPNIQFTFQQDNAPVHSSASTRRWLLDNNVSMLGWPARSPDLNPIENLWGVSSCRLCRIEAILKCRTA